MHIFLLSKILPLRYLGYIFSVIWFYSYRQSLASPSSDLSSTTSPSYIATADSIHPSHAQAATLTKHSSKLENKRVNGDDYCLPLTKANQRNNYVLGEVSVTGLCNQLFGIYSYIPTAFFFNASLIVGPIHSRVSFADHYSTFHEKRYISLPFSSFFDLGHFSSYWSPEMQIVPMTKAVEKCYDPTATGASHPLLYSTTAIHRPRFETLTLERMPELLNKSNLSLPLPANLEKTIFRFQTEFKLVALYNFCNVNFSTSPHLQLLNRVHQSLRPAPPIRQAVNTVIDNLPNSFIGVHLRIEADLVEDDKFPVVLQTIRRQILATPCLQSYRSHPSANSFTNPPPIFVASGVFRSINNNRREKLSNQGKMDNDRQLNQFRERASKAMEMLQDLGFNKVLSRSDIMKLHFKSNMNDNNSQFGGGSNIAAGNKRLYPEQQAWVDLNVLRHKNCKCFIPAHAMSTYSYMVERLKQLDLGMLEFGTIPPSEGMSHEMWAWGF